MSDINFLENNKEKKTKSPEQKRTTSFHVPAADLSTKRRKSLSVTIFDRLKKIIRYRKKESVLKNTEKNHEQKLSSGTFDQAAPGAVPKTAGPTTQPDTKTGPIQQTARKFSPPATTWQDPLNSDFSDDLVDVNLMPWRDPYYRIKRTIRYGLVFSIFVIMIIWGLTLRIGNTNSQSQIDSLRNTVNSLEESLSNIDRQLLAEEGSQQALRQRKLVILLAELPRLTKLFDWLEQSTSQKVYFRNTAIENAGQLSLDAVATDFVAAAEQWQTFRQATSWVDSVLISNFTKGGTASDGVSFGIGLEIDPAALLINTEANP